LGPVDVTCRHAWAVWSAGEKRHNSTDSLPVKSSSVSGVSKLGSVPAFFSNRLALRTSCADAMSSWSQICSASKPSTCSSVSAPDAVADVDCHQSDVLLQRCLCNHIVPACMHDSFQGRYLQCGAGWGTLLESVGEDLHIGEMQIASGASLPWQRCSFEKRHESKLLFRGCSLPWQLNVRAMTAARRAAGRLLCW